MTVVVVIVGAALVLDVRTAHAELRMAADQVRTLQAQVEAGDREGAAATAMELPEHTAKARQATYGPHWTLLGKVPGLGVNVHAVQTVSAVVDDIAAGALSDLIEAVQVVDPSRMAPVEGRIALAPIVDVAPQVVRADETVQSARSTLEGVDSNALAEQLRGPVAELTGQVDAIASITATASRAVRLIPPMLGSEGPREYLLLVQNNAEPRATGGIPGAVVLLRADQGAIELVEQRPASSFGPFDEPVVEVTNVERAMFGTQLGRYMQDVTFTPDFPRSAEIAGEMWRREVGTDVDGVLSIDPVALQTLLQATGPVVLVNGQELTSENAAEILLNQVYLELETPSAQDKFFAMAAGTIFSSVMSGAADPASMVGLLDQVAEEGRLMMWSAHAREQALLAGTTLSGELRGSTRGAPVVGVYVNDRSAAKIGYYQDVRAEIEANTCRGDGSRVFTLVVTVSSSVPENYIELPAYLTGGGQTVPVGNIRSDVLVYAPTGGRILGARSSDEATSYTPRLHNGLSMGTHKLELLPQQSVTFEYDIETGPNQAGTPLVRMTPGPKDGQFLPLASPCRS
ncbi:DUF4012 domain-containing protein [Georgenia daeguensis]|uniref:DUF4012 domain-containing protein n=1 Tax=Georgenia daeguensis TaxID=908355 RepID=UPI0031EDC28C